MKLISQKTKLNGTVAIPGSKSHTIRAVAIASLARGRSMIRQPLSSSDTLSAVDCYRLLGAAIDTGNPELWIVDGTGGHLTLPQQTIDVGNSGTTLRVALGSAALAPADQSCTFTGDRQIQSRPLHPLIEALNHLGAHCDSVQANGKAPVRIRGALQGGQTTLEAPTSQYLTSLLLACPLAPRDTDIDVTVLHEAGYVQMTLDWLDKQGIQYRHDNMKTWHIPGNQSYQAFDLPVPADFSSATFFLCGAALFGGEVLLTGLDFNDSQPDKAVADYLQAMGARMEHTQAGLKVYGSPLTGRDIDMNDTPDALPAMAVTAALAQGTTRLLNVPQARSKETDRIACMAQELTKLGANVEELPDGLVIQGGRLKSAPVQGHHDHRIVMALALAGMSLDEPCEIDTAEAMNVTFPTFAALMSALGAHLKLR